MIPLDFYVHDAYIAVSASGRWILVGMTFVFGAIIGSFANVVVYRLPRRLSLVRPGSQCPACGHTIRWHDNVPILGWLWLGGRCRDCHARISVRYPLVELLLAVVSALLGWSSLVELAPGGDVRIDGPFFSFGLVGYVFYFLLAVVLICSALMELDGYVPRAGMLGPALVVGFAIGSVWPDVRLWTGGADQAWRGVYDGVAGLLAAGVLGALAWPGCLARIEKPDLLAGLAVWLELGLLGVYLGAGQAAVLIAGGAVCYAAARIVAGPWHPAARIGWSTALAVMLLAGIAVRPFGINVSPWPASWDALTAVILAGGIVAFVSILRAIGLVRPPSLAA